MRRGSIFIKIMVWSPHVGGHNSHNALHACFSCDHIACTKLNLIQTTKLKS